MWNVKMWKNIKILMQRDMHHNESISTSGPLELV